MASSKLKKNYLVEKKNVLSEFRSNKMSLQELRFFSIYLAKINARDVNTRVVRFEISEFQRIMGLNQPNINHLKNITDRLLGKIAHVPSESGKGYIAFQLFKECKVDQDTNGTWYVEIDAHDRALPLMFDYKKDYFTYQLWNSLHLKSSNQLKFYECLKRWEYKGVVTLSLEEIRDMLGLESHQHQRWERFRTIVLDICQKALEEYTDIKFTYDLIRKGTGRGGASQTITHIKFTIKKNKNHVDPLSLNDFINLQPDPDIIDVTYDEIPTPISIPEEPKVHIPHNEHKDFIENEPTEKELIEIEHEEDPDERYEPHLRFIADACDYRFSNAQMQIIFNFIAPLKNEFDRYHLIKASYDRLKMYEANIESQKGIFNYFEKILATEFNKKRSQSSDQIR